MSKRIYKTNQADRKVELQQAMNKLEQGVQDVFKGKNFQDYLKFCARLPKYSLNNQILIMLQDPKATICQSYNGWKAIGRTVKKGEKGIRILAPNPFKVKKEQKVFDENGDQLFDQAGNPVMEIVEVPVMSYRLVSTFDVRQTEGADLPVNSVEELTAGVDGYSKLFDALTKASGVQVEFENIESGAKGYYSVDRDIIVLNSGMSESQTLKTLIHETAHQMLHSKDALKGQAKKSRYLKETEAESVAFVVCQHFGIDTSDYTFGYVAGWSEGKDLKELKQALDTIRSTAAQIIEKTEDILVEKKSGVA